MQENSRFLGHATYDNVLVAFESLHYMKRKSRSKQRKSRSKQGVTSLKIDISKAYDQIS